MTSWKEHEISIYCFITEIQNKERGPFIRTDNLPSNEVVLGGFEIPASRFSNSIQFFGKMEAKANFSDQIELVSSDLLKSSEQKFIENTFNNTLISTDIKERMCNLNIDLSIVINVAEVASP